METTTFKVRINEGPEQEVTINCGVYEKAVRVALYTLDYDHEVFLPLKDKLDYRIVKVWHPELIHPQYNTQGEQVSRGYGPYYYAEDHGGEIYSISTRLDLDEWTGDSANP